MTPAHNKPLMRCLGEFVGHVVRAVRPASSHHVLERKVQEKQDGGVTLRRTTIDEIEIKQDRGDD